MIVTKDQREIELMREAGRIVALVHSQLKEFIKPGITTAQINKFCEKFIFPSANNISTVNIVGIINIIPPIVGTPSLFLCVLLKKILIFCFTFIFFNTGIIIKPNITDKAKPIIIASTAFVSTNIIIIS